MRAAWFFVLVACGDNTPDESSCALYERPVRTARGCGDPSDPFTLVACDVGSADVGAWAIDDDGLPAFDVLVDQRCDEAAHAWSPRDAVGRPVRDPVHVVGDGYGTVAMAHASGGLDVYTQDRGHKWPVRIDTWRDPDRPAFVPQIGGAIGYVVDGSRVLSTRFEDLPVERALAMQSRRFGVGYVETRTDFGGLVVSRRTFAAPKSRTLVTEVTIENNSRETKQLGIVELYDVNLHQISAELVTSDLLAPSITRDIERRRRAQAAELEHVARYDAGTAVAAIASRWRTPPPVGADDAAPIDYYPETLWLASLDHAPDAAWLVDHELWDDAERAPPRGAVSGTAASRTIEFSAENQPGVLALRVPAAVAPGERVVRRFAFGVVPHEADPIAAARAFETGEGRAAAASWRERLVWAAFPGQPHAGALQRELVWSSYAIQALATYDAYYGTRLVGQGGSYKFIHGIDGAIGDYALFAEAVLAIDPELAADTLALAFATQRARSAADAGRYPYATTGVGDFTDVVRYDLRSDAYFLMPSLVGKYVGLTRDRAFLDREIAYWPRSANERGSVLDHLRLTQEFADTALGFGAHGLVAMGTNDYADGVLQTATEPATPHGASSTFNAWLLAEGFPLVARIVAPRDAVLAARYDAVRGDQLARLEQVAWTGERYHRGFVDSGNPLGADNFYLEPQVLPILAGAVTPERRAQLLDLVERVADTPIGPMTVVPFAPNTPGEPQIDEPQIGGVWPVASAWLTEAYALADPAKGWSSLVRNTLFAHAEAFPHLWYGVWTGPDSYYGPDAERPGEADAHLATALTDYPALNTHVHASLLRAVFAVAGIRGSDDGIRIAPRFPTQAFAIAWPRISLASTPTSIAGSITPVGAGPIVLRVRTNATRVTVDGAATISSRDGADVVFAIDARANTKHTWSID